MRHGDLALQQRELSVAEVGVAGDAGELDGKVRARDGRDVGGDVAEGGVERWDGRVVKVVPGRDALDLAQGRVACPDHGHGPGGDGCAVEGGQVPCVAQGLERLDDVRERCGAVGLDVDEEV